MLRQKLTKPAPALGTAVLCAVLAIASPTAATAQTTIQTAATAHPAARASDFVNALGVGIHLGASTGPYASASSVASALTYIGIYHVRDNALILNKSNAWQWAKNSALIAKGVKFDGTVGVDPAPLMAQWQQISSVIDFLEGPNEVDATTYSYNGQTGNPAAIGIQKALYSGAKNTAALSTLPILNLTVWNPPDSAQIGNLSAWADFTNMHVYPCAGTPAANIQSNFSGTVSSPGRPLIITESGYSTVLYNSVSASHNGKCGVSQDIQARYLLDDAFDAIKFGAKRIYLYELADDSLDPGNTDREYHYGLYLADWTPKTVATAFHNLTTILNDPATSASTFAPGSLTYTLTDSSPGPINFTNFSLLLQKSGGPFELAVWTEPLLWDVNAHQALTGLQTHAVTLTLPKAASKISVFDPMTGTTATQSLSNATSVQLSVVDHPLIVQITP